MANMGLLQEVVRECTMVVMEEYDYKALKPSSISC
jgi:hypothetical protein